MLLLSSHTVWFLACDMLGLLLLTAVVSVNIPPLSSKRGRRALLPSRRAPLPYALLCGQKPCNCHCITMLCAQCHVCYTNTPSHTFSNTSITALCGFECHSHPGLGSPCCPLPWFPIQAPPAICTVCAKPRAHPSGSPHNKQHAVHTAEVMP